MSVREQLSSALESMASAIRPSTMKDVVYVSGWPGFPPLPDDCSAREYEDYLDRCQVHEVLVDRLSRLSVTLLDPDRQPWVFRFGRAGLQLERYSDEHGTEGPEPGIENLTMYHPVKAMPDEARQEDVTVYELDGVVGLVIEGRSVQVIPPGGMSSFVADPSQQ